MRDDLRAAVTVVAQDATILGGTVAENVHPWAPVSDERVREALKLARADVLVDALPLRLEDAQHALLRSRRLLHTRLGSVELLMGLGLSGLWRRDRFGSSHSAGTTRPEEHEAHG